jgi:hypothetical protein
MRVGSYLYGECNNKTNDLKDEPIISLITVINDLNMHFHYRKYISNVVYIH